MKLNNGYSQRGMAPLELFLIIIILAILGFIGWYVYDSSKKTKNSYDSTSQTSSQSAASKPATAEKTLTFKEHGVKINLSDTIKDITYTAKEVDVGDGTTSTSLFLNDAALAKAIDDCNTTKGSNGNFAALGKANGQFPAEPDPGVGLAKQFDAFYISISYPNGAPCEDQSKADAVVADMQKLQKAVVEAFKTASLVQ